MEPQGAQGPIAMLCFKCEMSCMGSDVHTLGHQVMSLFGEVVDRLEGEVRLEEVGLNCPGPLLVCSLFPD